jgi:hypothetical protein
MAKKSTKPAAAATKKPAPTKKAAPAKAKKKAPAKKNAPVEIELDAAEAKAIELVHTTDKVCTELEVAVTTAVAQAVGKVFKKHSISLTSAQAEKVALLLFGD